jgi:hypothetical protein
MRLDADPMPPEDQHVEVECPRSPARPGAAAEGALDPFQRRK